MSNEKSEMEQLLDFVRKSRGELTIRYEKEYDTFLFRVREYGRHGHEALRHVYPDEISEIVPGMIDEMAFDLSIAEEEAEADSWDY